MKYCNKIESQNTLIVPETAFSYIFIKIKLINGLILNRFILELFLRSMHAISIVINAVHD